MKCVNLLTQTVFSLICSPEWFRALSTRIELTNYAVYVQIHMHGALENCFSVCDKLTVIFSKLIVIFSCTVYPHSERINSN